MRHRRPGGRAAESSLPGRPPHRPRPKDGLRICWFGRDPFAGLPVALTRPAMGWICGKQFFYAAGMIFFASWFPTYLRETRGLALGRAGVLTSLPLLAIVVGCLVGGVVSDWIYARTGSRS